MMMNTILAESSLQVVTKVCQCRLVGLLTPDLMSRALDSLTDKRKRSQRADRDAVPVKATTRQGKEEIVV